MAQEGGAARTVVVPDAASAATPTPADGVITVKAPPRHGVALLGLLVLLALGGMASLRYGEGAAAARQHDQESRLLWVGNQYRRAIESYYFATPGPAKHLPVRLENLLRDDRFPQPVRHLRKLYPDPLAPDTPWGLLKRGSQIVGVYSQAEGTPFRSVDLGPGLESMQGAGELCRLALHVRPTHRPDQRRRRAATRSFHRSSFENRTMSHRILIVEDHALLRHGLRALLTLQAEYRVVGEAVDGREAVLKAMDLQPDLIVMDLSLPGMSGVDATAQIRRRLPQQRVLALSEYDNEIHASEALRAGCAGYVMKHATPDELLLAVRTVLVGRRFISPEMTNLLLNGMLHPGQSTREINRWDSLSERERSIFKLIAEGGTNRSAATALNLSTKTVEKHRANMMRKLHLSSAVELALLAVDMGLVTRPQSHRPAAALQTGQAVAPG